MPRDNPLPISLIGMSPAEVHWNILPSLKKTGTESLPEYLAIICEEYFTVTHNVLDVIRFLQIVFATEPILNSGIVWENVSAAILRLDHTSAILGVRVTDLLLEPENNLPVVYMSQIQQILTIDEKLTSTVDKAKAIQENLDTIQNPLEDDARIELQEELLMVLEYRDDLALADLLREHNGLPHILLITKYNTRIPIENNNIQAGKRAMLYALHTHAHERSERNDQASIPFLEISLLDLEDPNVQAFTTVTSPRGLQDCLDKNLARIVLGKNAMQFICSLIVYYTQHKKNKLAAELQRRYQIHNREMMQVCERSRDLEAMRYGDSVHYLTQATNYFAALYQEELENASLASIQREINAIDTSEAPTEVSRYRRQVLSAYKADLVQYRQQRGLDFNNPKHRNLKGFVLPSDLTKFSKLYSNSFDQIIEGINTDDDFSDRPLKPLLSRIHEEVERQKAHKTDLSFLLQLIALCYKKGEDTLANALHTKYQISPAEMALVWLNTADALRRRPNKTKEDDETIYEYEIASRQLDTDPSFQKLEQESVTVDPEEFIQNYTDQNTIKIMIRQFELDPEGKNLKTIMEFFDVKTPSLDWLCNLIAYCKTQEGMGVEWANHLQTTYFISNSMMVLVCLNSRNTMLADTFAHFQLRGQLALLQTWLETAKIEKARKDQCTIVTAFRNEIMKLYDGPPYPTHPQYELLINIGEQLTLYFDKVYKNDTDVIQNSKLKLLALNDKLYHAGRSPSQKTNLKIVQGLFIISSLLLLATGLGLIAMAGMTPLGAVGLLPIAAAVVLPFFYNPQKFFKPAQDAGKVSALIKSSLNPPTPGM